MVKKEEIDAALAAHSLWKKRLQDAISSGHSEFKPDIVKKDNVCDFGKWFFGLSKETAQTEGYKNVKALHADFHKIAGEILILALAGKKDEALKQIEVGGPYYVTTGKLVLALRAWKAKL
jgi:hypothetical protein